MKIVLTGGPGAGKTAVLETARHALQEHVDVLPEAASIVFGGGFPRRKDDPARCAAQRAIYHVQNELERLPPLQRVTLCDRGTIDALAYWPGRWDDFFAQVESTLERELARYDAVVHLRVPAVGHGYHTTAIRIENAGQAHDIDRLLLDVWSRHPRRIIIETDLDFLAKAQRTIDAIRQLIGQSG